MNTLKKHRGFTLIELIIVIMIMGLLAGLAAPKFIGISRDAQVAALVQDIDTLEKVIPVYYTKHQEYPLDMDNPIAFKDDSPLLIALQNNGESGDSLYKVNLNKTRPYHSKLKYGNTGINGDYFIYSMDTGRVYYAKGVMNGNGLLVFGHGIQTKNTLRNLALSDIPVISNQEMEVSHKEHTLSGEVLVTETVTVTHNGKPISVEYEDIVYQSKLTKVYANSGKYKKFTAKLTLETSKPNKIEVSTSKETEVFTVKVHALSVKEAKQMAAGFNHTAVLMNDGTVWTWGNNKCGQLGDETTEDRFTPVQVKNLSNAKQVTAGNSFNIVLLKNGTVWAWGSNGQGRLGNGTKKDQPCPVQVKNLSNVKQVATEAWHSLALLEDGTVMAWGKNFYGQLGNGNTIDRSTPVQVKDLSNVKQVTAGESHSLALLKDGTVWAWGSNGSGRLGDGTTTYRKTPVQVQNLSNVKQVVAGFNHSYALLENGTVWAWGGNEITGKQLTPVQVQNLLE